jgi:hypothetical protein
LRNFGIEVLTKWLASNKVRATFILITKLHKVVLQNAHQIAQTIAQ